jgi:hypothetical protein
MNESITNSISIPPDVVRHMDFKDFCPTMIAIVEGREKLESKDQSEVARVQNFRAVKVTTKTPRHQA